jgi:hypothetical protein
MMTRRTFDRCTKVGEIVVSFANARARQIALRGYPPRGLSATLGLASSDSPLASSCEGKLAVVSNGPRVLGPVALLVERNGGKTALWEA